MGTILSSSMRRKKAIYKPETGPSPCKACPRLKICMDQELDCEKLIAWQAKNRNGTRVIYVTTHA